MQYKEPLQLIGNAKNHAEVANQAFLRLKTMQKLQI
jgi:hypothetical protein